MKEYNYDITKISLQLLVIINHSHKYTPYNMMI